MGSNGFPDFRFRISTHRNEVTQRDRTKAVGRIDISKHPLNNQLRVAIGIDD